MFAIVSSKDLYHGKRTLACVWATHLKYVSLKKIIEVLCLAEGFWLDPNCVTMEIPSQQSANVKNLMLQKR